MKLHWIIPALALFNPALVLAPMEGVDLQGFQARVTEELMGTDPLNLSPAHHVLHGTPPAIIFHGRADTTVPNSRWLCQTPVNS